jgi:type II secretory pathway component PulK
MQPDAALPPPAARASRHTRRGVALLTVLWVVATGSIIAGAMLLRSRETVGAAANRASLIRASWRADGCAVELVALLDDRLRSTARRDTLWRQLDRVIAPTDLPTECRTTIRPVGTAVDVNAADERQLRALFRAAGLSAPHVDSLTDAILDWVDSDDTPRPSGAEKAWYAQRGLSSPRDGPVAAWAELRRIRGLDADSGAASLLTTESGRILIDRAPLAVLASLPGVSDEVTIRIAARRQSGDPTLSWAQLAGELSTTARAELMRELLELDRRSTVTPDAWIAEIDVSDGHPAMTATHELRLVLWGEGVMVSRRRSSP